MPLSKMHRIVYRFMELPHTRQYRLLREFDLIIEDAPYLVREDRIPAQKTAFKLIAEREAWAVFGAKVDSETVEVRR